jgi:hypothetical protein
MGLKSLVVTVIATLAVPISAQEAPVPTFAALFENDGVTYLYSRIIDELDAEADHVAVAEAIGGIPDPDDVHPSFALPRETAASLGVNPPTQSVYRFGAAGVCAVALGPPTVVFERSDNFGEFTAGFPLSGCPETTGLAPVALLAEVPVNWRWIPAVEGELTQLAPGLSPSDPVLAERSSAWPASLQGYEAGDYAEYMARAEAGELLVARHTRISQAATATEAAQALGMNTFVHPDVPLEELRCAETYREFVYREIGVRRGDDFRPTPGYSNHDLWGALAEGDSIRHVVTGRTCRTNVFSFAHGDWLELNGNFAICYGLVEEDHEEYPLSVVPVCPHG